MSALSCRIWPETLRMIDSATFTGSYQAVGSALSNSIRLIKIYNDASVPITVSWDGINDMDYVPTKGFVLYDVSTNRETSNVLEIAANTRFYVKGSAGTGSVYITALYAR